MISIKEMYMVNILSFIYRGRYNSQIVNYNLYAIMYQLMINQRLSIKGR